jgi:3-oxoadipate enol-lactonase
LTALVLRNQLLWANEERFYDQEGALQATIDYVLSLPQPQGRSGFIRQANACIAHDGSEICSHIRTPSLVLVGAQERVFSVAEVLALSQRIPGARYQCFAHGGHNLWLEYPSEVLAAINTFVASLE